jgi:hypothetical protein
MDDGSEEMMRDGIDVNGDNEMRAMNKSGS